MTELSGLHSYQIITCIHHSRRFNLYQAIKADTLQEVLIKTPDPARSNDAELISSLTTEADCGKKLSHPHIREVYNFQQDANSAFLIGEYIPGKSLAWSLEQSPGLDTVLVWLQDILEALVYAHAKGICHLNLNPHNIIIDETQHARLIGFGKSKVAYLNREDTFYLYHPILFVAPEQYQAGIGHPTSDLFSLAALCYLMLCGVPPWRIDLQLSHEQQKQQSLCRAVIMPERLGKIIPDWLFGIILQCLKLDPQLRLESAEQMLQAVKSRGASLIAGSDVLTAESAEPTIAEQATEPASDAIEETITPEPDIIEPVATESQQEEQALVEELPAITPEQLEPVAEEISLAFADLIDKVHLPSAEILDGVTSAAEIAFSLPTVEELQSPELQLVSEPVEPAEEPQPVSIMEVTAKQIPPRLPSIPSAAPEQKQEPKQNYTWRAQPEPEPEGQERKKLHKTFVILLWLSLVVLLFVVVKYFVFEARPKFSSTPEETENVEQIAQPGEENQPLSLIPVPADTLVMGSLMPEAESDEFPLLTVSIAPFYISPREISQKEWLMVFPDNPSQFKDLDLPVDNVSFYDVIEFCNAKSIKDGFHPCYDYYDTEVICNFAADGYRLPTEAEWEFAAKAGERKDFQVFSGSDNADEVGWHNGNSNAASHVSGKLKPNKLGLYDLSGNMFEWVWNWYAPYSFRYDDPRIGPNNGTDKVIRGGSWYHPASEMRVSNRSFSKPYTKSGYIGFRVVRSAVN